MPLEDAEPDQSSARPRKELRKITDARTMRALAHPVRIALAEELALGGAMTATELGELIGESPTTCSFHLRQLAKYGWVEEAGGGKGRARPWRLSAIGYSLASSHDDPETDIAAATLTNMVVERQLNRYRAWQETKATYPRPWRDAATSSEYLFYLTAGELDQFTDQMHELLMSKFPLDRLTDPSKRPPGSVPVELLLFAYPMQLPKPSEASASDAPADEGAGG